MNNSIDWLIAYFGIVRTGAWVVPLNFRFSADDLKYCSDVAQPKAMVFDEEFTPRIDAVRDQLPAKDYICFGKEIPSYAEDFTEPRRWGACYAPRHGDRLRRPLRPLFHVGDDRAAEADPPYPQEHGVRLHHGERPPPPDEEGQCSSSYPRSTIRGRRCTGSAASSSARPPSY